MEFFPDLSPELFGGVLFNALSFLLPTARRRTKEEMVSVDGVHARFAAGRKENEREKEGEMDGSLSPWALVRERTPRAFRSSLYFYRVVRRCMNIDIISPLLFCLYEINRLHQRVRIHRRSQSG